MQSSTDGQAIGAILISFLVLVFYIAQKLKSSEFLFESGSGEFH